jgi:hypothetical protein
MSPIVYYESIKREPKIRGIKKCRCDERLLIPKKKKEEKKPFCFLSLFRDEFVRIGFCRPKNLVMSLLT